MRGREGTEESECIWLCVYSASLRYASLYSLCNRLHISCVLMRHLPCGMIGS